VLRDKGSKEQKNKGSKELILSKKQKPPLGGFFYCLRKLRTSVPQHLRTSF